MQVEAEATIEGKWKLEIECEDISFQLQQVLSPFYFIYYLFLLS